MTITTQRQHVVKIADNGTTVTTKNRFTLTFIRDYTSSE